MADVVTTVLELAAVLLLALGLGMIAAAAAGGGLLGYGTGITTAALVLGASSAVLRAVAGPAEQAAGRRR